MVNVAKIILKYIIILSLNSGGKIMRRALILIAAIGIMGCVTVEMPKYIHEDFPYRQDFSAGFEPTFYATVETLKELGWSITETTDPAAFDPGMKDKRRQILIFTQIRQTPLFLISSYSSLNAYLREMDKDRTQVEIRYLYVMPLPFKNRSSYQNDPLIKKIFNRITEKLNR
jgi:hypothetical protein